MSSDTQTRLILMSLAADMGATADGVIDRWFGDNLDERHTPPGGGR